MSVVIEECYILMAPTDLSWGLLSAKICCFCVGTTPSIPCILVGVDTDAGLNCAVSVHDFCIYCSLLVAWQENETGKETKSSPEQPFQISDD